MGATPSAAAKHVDSVWLSPGAWSRTAIKEHGRPSKQGVHVRRRKWADGATEASSTDPGYVSGGEGGAEGWRRRPPALNEKTVIRKRDR